MVKKTSNAISSLKKSSKPKRTSIGHGFLSKSMMNKHKKRCFKVYRGQGK
jgi:hypothetical protein